MRYEDENLLAACSDPVLPNKDRRTQASRLLGLPVELQNNVFRNADRGDFKALSQTCVALRAAVVSLILERVILSGNSPRLSSVVQTLEDTISKSKEPAGIIRHMQLLDDDVISGILSRLLQRTSKLKSLVYGCIIAEGPNGNDEIDARALSRLLEPVRNTLNNLKITYILDLNECDAGGSPCVDGRLHLKEMVALKKLETTFTLLFGPSSRKAPRLGDILPPGLVELRILSDPWEIDPARWYPGERVEAVAGYVRDGNWKRSTPNLRLLNYNMDSWRGVNGREEKCAAAEEPLAELVRENGLQWNLEIPPKQLITNLLLEAQERMSGEYEEESAGSSTSPA